MSALLDKTEPMKATSGQVRHALKSYYAQPEYGLVFEVAQGTGWKANRHLDAMAMSLWPSRGLLLYGIEIKVDRGDWRREKRDPEKAEQLARFCHCFYIAAPAGVVPHSELPPNWGLLELQKNGQLRQVVAAVRLTPEPVDYHFLAAVFRASGRERDPDTADAAIKAHRAKLEAEFEDRLESALKARRNEFEQDALHWRELMQIVGKPPEDTRRWFNSPGLLEAVRAIHRSGLTGQFGRLNSLHKSLEVALADLKVAMEGFPEE